MKILGSNHSLEIQEHPPVKRSYEFGGEFYFLQFPWMYFFSQKKAKSIRIMGSLKKINKPSEEIFLMPLGHNYFNSICMEDYGDYDNLPDSIFTNNTYLPGRTYQAIYQSLGLGAQEFFMAWEKDFSVFEKISTKLIQSRFDCLSLSTRINWD